MPPKAKSTKPVLTVRHLVEEYLLAARARHVTDSQGESLRWITTHMGKLTPDQLTPARLRDYQFHDRAGRSPGTLRRELGALQAALNWAGRQRLVSRDLLPDIALPAPGPPRSE